MNVSKLRKRIESGVLDNSELALNGQKIKRLNYKAINSENFTIPDGMLNISNCLFNSALFERCSISFAVFNLSEFQKARFKDCEFYFCDFMRCDFFQAEFVNCKFLRCNFHSAFFGMAKFRKCLFNLCVLDEAIVYGVEFQSTNLDMFTLAGTIDKSIDSITSAARKTGNIYTFLEYRNSIDDESIVKTIISLKVRRQAMDNYPDGIMDDGELYSAYLVRKYSTLSEIESFLGFSNASKFQKRLLLDQFVREARVPSIFISYSFRDSEIAALIAKVFGTRGCKVWFAPNRMEAGVDISEQLDFGLHESDVLLPLISQNSASSSWCRGEVEQFANRMKLNPALRIFPVTLDPGLTLQSYDSGGAIDFSSALKPDSLFCLDLSEQADDAEVLSKLIALIDLVDPAGEARRQAKLAANQLEFLSV